MPTPTTPTPTPWEVTGKVEEGDGEVSIVSTTEQEEVCQVFGGDAIEANAHHIVHCVNTHAALVAALEGCLRVTKAWLADETQREDTVGIAAAQQELDRINHTLAQERNAP